MRIRSRTLQAMAAHLTDVEDAANPQVQAYANAQAYYEDLAKVSGLAELQGEMDVNVLTLQELQEGRNPQAVFSRLLAEMEQGGTAAPGVAETIEDFAFTATTRYAWAGEGFDGAELVDVWRFQADELRSAAARIDTSTAEGAERAAALEKVANMLQQGADNMSRFGMDPRPRFLDEIRQLEARQFLDGGNGAGEASVLRVAIAECGMAVEDFRSGLDLPPVPAPGAYGALPPGALDELPAYPGLPTEFGEDLRLTVDPPAYVDDLPPDAMATLWRTGEEAAAGEDVFTSYGITYLRVDRRLLPPGRGDADARDGEAAGGAPASGRPLWQGGVQREAGRNSRRNTVGR